MKESTLLKMILAGRDLSKLREDFKFTIALECGEEFSFHDYKIIRQNADFVDFKINFRFSGLYIPRDRIVNRKGVKTTIKRHTRIFHSMIKSTNVPEIVVKKEITKERKPRKKKEIPKAQIVGELFLQLGRVPTEKEIQNYK